VCMRILSRLEDQSRGLDPGYSLIIAIRGELPILAATSEKKLSSRNHIISLQHDLALLKESLGCPYTEGLFA